MTISNLVVQPDAAYLLSDTVFLAPDRRALGFAPKVLHFPDQCAAVSACGSQGFAVVDVVAEYHRTGKAFSFDGFLQTVREVFDREGYDDATHFMNWTAIYYSKEHSRPYGFCFTTHPSGGGEGYAPWRWHPRRVLIAPYVEPSLVFGPNAGRVSLPDPAQFDPMADFMKFALQQRQVRYEGGHFGVGGEVYLTRAAADGLRQWKLHDFGDREGELIESAV